LPEESAQNQFTLAGEFELMLTQVLLQSLHFLHMCICQVGPPMGLIKDETCPTGQGVSCVNGIEGRN
jgi:hypothetical protein